ncbi:MAG: hypothetical protein HN348_33140, partial [Proteobacteria bacterium]|nr:hypothetical protein [Pseudomonadota bacterium]
MNGPVRRVAALCWSARAVGVRELLRHSRRRDIRSVAGNTLLPHRRLSHLADLAMSAPNGAIVECGSYLGGSAALMALSCPERSVWLFDSWQGCPEPTERDFDCHGEPGRAGDFSASEHRTRTFLYGDLGLSQNRVRMVKGWFTETLGGAVETIGPIGLLHLDSDWYTSTREALEA